MRMLVWALLWGRILEVSALEWKGPAFFLVTRGMPLKQVLQDLGATYATPVVVSAAVDDFFIGTLQNKGPEQLLSELSSTYGLLWYEDGNTLYVYKASEVVTAVLTPNYVTAAQIAHYLDNGADLHSGSCRVRQVDTFNAFEVFGVPACIRRVQKLVKELDEKSEFIAKNRDTIQFFPLRHAQAQDMTYTYRDQTVMVPGVVTLLKEMNQALASDKNSEGASAFFSADVRKNAVVVRDRAITMPLYAKLIAEMDEKPQQVEISVSIIDVHEEALMNLGLDASFKTKYKNLEVHFDAPLLKRESSALNANVSNPELFMLRVHALQERSNAHIISQPSVVTLNNMQAIIDQKTTFYTKVQSDSAAKLEAITCGTLLRVTPRVMEGGQEVHLQINIQDGRQESSFSATESLPQVKESEVLTQAQLKVGEGLLLGGFVKEEVSDRRRQIPLLGSIPLLGRLFSGTHQQKQRVVRLFLIKAEPLRAEEGEEGEDALFLCEDQIERCERTGAE